MFALLGTPLPIITLSWRNEAQAYNKDAKEVIFATIICSRYIMTTTCFLPLKYVYRYNNIIIIMPLNSLSQLLYNNYRIVTILFHLCTT